MQFQKFWAADSDDSQEARLVSNTDNPSMDFESTEDENQTCPSDLKNFSPFAPKHSCCKEGQSCFCAPAAYFPKSETTNPKARSRPPGDPPPEHMLPAAYLMWQELALLVDQAAREWAEEEFQFQKHRATIMQEIQTQQLVKALLESALEEMARQEELLEMAKRLKRQGLFPQG